MGKVNWPGTRPRPRPSVSPPVRPQLRGTEAGALWERDLPGALKVLEFVVETREAKGRGHCSRREQQSKPGGEGSGAIRPPDWRRRPTKGRAARVCWALSVGPGCPGFMCRHQGAAVLPEEGCSGQRALFGQEGSRWGVAGWEVEKWEARGRHMGDGVRLGLRSELPDLLRRLDAPWC